MPKIVRSIKGEQVDFDMLKIKQSIASAPSPLEVSERRDYIDNKLQRRIRRAKEELQRNTSSKPKNGLIDMKEVDGTTSAETVVKQPKPEGTETEMVEPTIESARTIKKGTV